MNSDELNTIISTSMDGFLLVGLTGRILETNDSYCQLVGYTRDQLLGMNISALDAIESAEDVAERSDRIIRTGPMRFDTAHRHKDGSIIDIEVSAHYTPQHGGSFFSLIRDISHHKQIEKTLRESEQKYRLIFESAGDSISVMNLQGILLTVNPLACKMLGYTYDELMAVPLERIDTQPQLLPELIGIVLNKGQNTFDTKHWRKDGSVITISVDSRLITWDGQPAIMNICRDITERKQTEEKLQEAIQFSDQIICCAREGIIVCDLDLRLRIWNPYMEQISGITACEALGRHPSELFPSLVEMGLLDRLQGILSGETPAAIEYPYDIPESGSKGWVTDCSGPLLDVGGTIIGVISIIQDTTERKIAEEQRLQLERQFLQAQKLESLGVMAGGIAHDFNNLLQSVLGNMELALMKLPPDSVPRKHIVSAMKSGKHAAHLTSLMLAYSGKGFITKKELNLNEMVRENIEILKSAASTTVTMKLYLSAELPSIMADEAQIQQVVMNLILNAAESIQEPPGLVTLTTGVKSYDQRYLDASLLGEKPSPGRYVFLKVRDNGCGMSEETIKRLFDPFFTTKFTGRGLGMSAVMGILRTHRGALFVESELGKGTTFQVLFPIPESAPPAQIQEPVTSPKKLQLSGVALVVDDEKSVLKICSKMVKLCGFTVISACDGIDAVAKFREHSDEIDVVLMDLTMPNMDGIAAMKEIYSIRPATRLILSSGFNEEDLSKSITGQSPTGFIRKPYNMNLLEEELRRVMQAD